MEGFSVYIQIVDKIDYQGKTKEEAYAAYARELLIAN